MQVTSRFRGVCWNKKNRRWQAAINAGGKYIYLGSYTDEEDAARAFDKEAIKQRGGKAKLNFPEDRIKYMNEFNLYGQAAHQDNIPSKQLLSLINFPNAMPLEDLYRLSYLESGGGQSLNGSLFLDDSQDMLHSDFYCLQSLAMQSKNRGFSGRSGQSSHDIF